MQVFVGTGFYAIQNGKADASQDVTNMDNLTPEKRKQGERTANIMLAIEIIMSLCVTFITAYYAKDKVMQKLQSLEKQEMPANAQDQEDPQDSNNDEELLIMKPQKAK